MFTTSSALRDGALYHQVETNQSEFADQLFSIVLANSRKPYLRAFGSGWFLILFSCSAEQLEDFIATATTATEARMGTRQ
jgi:hypothetical protein